MCSIVILTKDAPLPEASEASAKSVFFHWDKLDVPAGQRSVPAWFNAHVAELRQELLAFVYELGWLTLPGGQVQERLKAGNALSMWWCSLLFEKHPKVTEGLYDALKLRALERMLEEAVAENVAAGTCDLELHGGEAGLVTALRDFCAATGRGFRHIPVRREKEQLSLKMRLRRCYHALPGVAKAVLRFADWLWRVRRHVPHTSSPRPAMACGTIASYFPNVDMKAAEQGRLRSRYWESLHTALAQGFADEQTEAGTMASASSPASSPASSSNPSPVNWLFIRFPSPQLSFRQCLALRDTFRKEGKDGASFHYLEEFLSTGDIWQAVRRYARLALASRSMEDDVRPHFHLAGSRMNLWPFFGDCWKDSFQGWRCLERCLQRRAMQAYVDWCGPQRWTIFPMENCPWERMLTEAVHAAGHGPVYGTQHSTVRPTDFRYFDDARSFDDAEGRRYQPDMLYGNGQGACAEMLAAGTPPQRLGMVEALRYMYLAELLQKAQQEHVAHPTAQGQAVPCASSTPARRQLLVVTSFFDDEVEAHVATLARWMREDAMAQDWDVCVKAHPYLAVEPYFARHFAGAKSPQVLTKPIGELLEKAVAQGEGVTVVWASNSTTVALEAALMGLPVLVQWPEDDVDLCPLQGVRGVARIATATDVMLALSHPQRAELPGDYLALDADLPRWRRLLGLR